MVVEFSGVGVLLIYLGIAALAVAVFNWMFKNADEETRGMIPESAALPLFVVWALIWPVVLMIFIRMVFAAMRKSRSEDGS